MKKALLLWVLVFAVAGLLHAQSTSRTFDLKDFDKVSVGDAFKINIKAGAGFSVVATGDASDLEDLVGKVSGGTLTLKFNSRKSHRKGVTLDIEMPGISKLDVSGASSAVAKGFSGGERLKIQVSGAAKLVMDVEVDDVQIDLTGASALTLSGKAKSLKGDVSGASSLKAADFPAKDIEIEASGASSATVKTTSRLLADASGASSIRYSGEGKDIRVNSSGGSTVKRVN